ncbi:hypothetical protein [Archangium sp.]|uniref:hypothetical protein n=1 Tax=Archangium sp. TaxID=1872627 RepID=UPI00286B5930|nr:hypothetical protein [Archangium sp.]
MKIILRNVLAVIAGFVLGSIVNMSLVTAGPHVFALPPGVDVNDMNSLKSSGHLMQPTNFIFPFLAHALGTLAGALTAHVIAASHRSVFAYTIGVLNLAGGIAASFMIPAPIWFIALDLLVAYLPMAWLATKLGQTLRPERAAVTA